jgi:hypothetical protein
MTSVLINFEPTAKSLAMVFQQGLKAEGIDVSLDETAESAKHWSSKPLTGSAQ